MFWLRPLILWWLLSGTALSQPIVVKSGEHGTFSRLVVYTKSPTAWQLGRVPGGYELQISDADVSYDLSTAFDFIPRTRIQNLLDLTKGKLRLQSTCACHANAFIAEGGQLVIDIIDGTETADTNKFEAYLRPPTKERNSATYQLEAEIDTQTARLGLPLLLPQETRSAPVQDVDGPENTLKPSEENATPLAPTGSANQERIQKTELALIEQLGRAAAQGLLDANLSTLDAEVERVTHPTEEPKVSPVPPAPPPQPESLPSNQHVAVQTSVDRESADQKSVISSTREGLACFPDEEFAVETWGDDITNGVDLARHQTGFLGEFDQPNSDVITAQARYLAFLTFGAEAKALVNRYRDSIKTPASLLQIAEIMDNKSAENASEVAPQMGCDGKTALWAALAQPEFRPGQEINSNAIISAFSELPLHLRRHLGPSLAQKFLSLGDNHTAVALRNALDRAGGDHGPGFEILEAQLEYQQGETQKAEERLTKVVNDDSELSPQAALDLMNERLKHDQAVPERIIEIASSFAFEMRGEPLGEQLKAATILAIAATSDFSRAFQQMDDGVSNGQLTADQASKLKKDILAQVLQKGSDSQFLRYVLDPDIDPSALTKSLRTGLSKRLLELGFPDEARSFLDVANDIPDMDQRLLYAQIALEQNKPNVALGYLAGLEGKAALKLQADALIMAKQYNAAEQVYATLGDTEGQKMANWRSGAWQRLATQDDSAISQASQLMLLPPSPPQPSNEGVLEQNQTLISQSEETRAKLNDLLSAFPSP